MPPPPPIYSILRTDIRNLTLGLEAAERLPNSPFKIELVERYMKALEASWLEYEPVCIPQPPK